MENAFNRLHQAIEYLKRKGQIHKQQDIANALGMGKSRVSESLKGKDGKFTRFFLEAFAAAYSDYINKDWLIDGTGQMEVPDSSLRPHIHNSARAGSLDGINEGDYGDDLRERIPFLGDYDFTITVQGDSMEPDFLDGDIVAAKFIRDRFNLPLGKICVLDTKDGILLKEIAGVEEDSVILHSLNPDYHDLAVPGDDIMQVADVVGLVRVSE